MRTITATVVSVETVTDPLGNETTTEVRSDVPGCLFAPRSSTERADPRSPAVITGAWLYLPADTTTPDPADYFLIDGTRYDVEGEPGVWTDRGIEVAVKHTT
jgi:hypothetical protein